MHPCDMDTPGDGCVRSHYYKLSHCSTLMLCQARSSSNVPQALRGCSVLRGYMHGMLRESEAVSHFQSHALTNGQRNRTSLLERVCSRTSNIRSRSAAQYPALLLFEISFECISPATVHRCNTCYAHVKLLTNNQVLVIWTYVSAHSS